MRIRVAIPDKHVDAHTLDALLEGVTRAGTRQILAGDAHDFRDVLESRAIQWQPENFADGEHFDLPALTQTRKWGDCDDLGPWYAASLRASGHDPGARAVARRSGPNRWHVEVLRSNGKREDPSRWAGMRPTVSGPATGVHALAARPLALPGDGAIALTRGASPTVWWARCDLPWNGRDGRSHIASLAPARSPDSAISRAVMGALYSSDGCSSGHREMAEVIANDLVDSWDNPDEGNLFGHIIRTDGTGIPGASIATGLCPGGRSVRYGGALMQAPLPGGAGVATWSAPGPMVVRF